jgi:heme/copper-type cytochrome/quinol oxidase subunit 2
MNANKFLLVLSFSCLIFAFPTLIIVKSQDLKEGVVPGVGSFGITDRVNIERPGQLLNIIAGTVKWVYTVFFIVAVIFILFAAFNYLSGGDNPEKLKTAHNQIIYAAIAIAVALLAVGASAIVQRFIEEEASGIINKSYAAAVSPGEIPGADALEIQESPIEEPQGIVDAIRGVAKWIYIIFFIIAIMFILFAAFNYLSGGGDAEKAKTAHNQIKYAVIAIAVALLAVGLEIIVKNFLQSGGGNGYGGDGYYKTYDSWRWLPFGGDQTPPPPERMPRTLQ